MFYSTGTTSRLGLLITSSISMAVLRSSSISTIIQVQQLVGSSKNLFFSHQTTPTTMFVSWSRLTGTGFQSKGFYLFGHFSMHIKLVPGDSAGTVTAFYVRFFISASYVLLLFNNVHACLTKHFVFDSCFSCLPKTRSTTRSTLSSWGTDQGSLIFFRQTYSREAVETGSRGSTYGSIRQKRTTPTPCCGTCTRLCK